MKFIIHTDGGARGNPGQAAVGVVIEKSQITHPNDQTKKEKIAEFGKCIGVSTNNVAEYIAVLEALQYLKIKNVNFKLENKEHLNIQFFLDSNLVVQQLNGKFKVKDGRLRELLMQIRMLEQDVGGAISYAYVPREQNRRADFLVNQALDGSAHVSFS